MIKRLFKVFLTGIGCWVALATGAQTPGGEIVEISGSLTNAQGMALKAGDAVPVGETLSTGAGSLAKLRLSPNQGLTMLENTALALEEAIPLLRNGIVVAQGIPAIRTQNGLVGTEQGRGLVESTEGRLLVVALFGTVSIKSVGWSLTLNPGEGTIFTSNQLATPKPISPEKLALRYPMLTQADPPVPLLAMPSPNPCRGTKSCAPTPSPTEAPPPQPTHNSIFISLGLGSALPLDEAPALVPGGMLGLSYYFQSEWGIHGALGSFFSSGFNTFYLPLTARYRYILNPDLAIYGGAGGFAAIAGQAGVIPGLVAEFGVDLNFPFVGLYAGTDLGLSFGNSWGVTIGLKMGFRYPL